MWKVVYSLWLEDRSQSPAYDYRTRPPLSGSGYSGYLWKDSIFLLCFLFLIHGWTPAYLVCEWVSPPRRVRQVVRFIGVSLQRWTISPLLREGMSCPALTHIFLPRGHWCTCKVLLSACRESFSDLWSLTLSQLWAGKWVWSELVRSRASDSQAMRRPSNSFIIVRRSGRRRTGWRVSRTKVCW